MGIRTCHNCKGPVSDQAAQCPHCGARPEGKGAAWQVIGIVFLLAVVAITLLGVLGATQRAQMSPEERKSLDAIRQCDKIADATKSSAQAHECFEMRADHGMRFGEMPRG